MSQAGEKKNLLLHIRHLFFSWTAHLAKSRLPTCLLLDLYLFISKSKLLSHFLWPPTRNFDGFIRFTFFVLLRRKLPPYKWSFCSILKPSSRRSDLWNKLKRMCRIKISPWKKSCSFKEGVSILKRIASITKNLHVRSLLC